MLTKTLKWTNANANTVRLQAVGDSVAEDEVVCEIETDKVRGVKSLLPDKAAGAPSDLLDSLLSTDFSAGAGASCWCDRGTAGARWGQSRGRNASF